jgi:hypothetical protein
MIPVRNKATQINSRRSVRTTDMLHSPRPKRDESKRPMMTLSARCPTLAPPPHHHTSNGLYHRAPTSLCMHLSKVTRFADTTDGLSLRLFDRNSTATYGLTRVSQGLAALRDFHPAYDRLGSIPLKKSPMRSLGPYRRVLNGELAPVSAATAETLSIGR